MDTGNRASPITLDGAGGGVGGRLMSTSTGTRTRRRQAIVELVSGERLGSQEEIRSRLAQLGHQATQSSTTT